MIEKQPGEEWPHCPVRGMLPCFGRKCAWYLEDELCCAVKRFGGCLFPPYTAYESVTGTTEWIKENGED